MSSSNEGLGLDQTDLRIATHLWQEGPGGCWAIEDIAEHLGRTPAIVEAALGQAGVDLYPGCH
jgi:DNA-binding MarR family transcriptional regulator